MKQRRLRIRTADVPWPLRPKGQDVTLEFVYEDGTVEPCGFDVRSVKIQAEVNGRSQYVTAWVEVMGVELDLQVGVIGKPENT